MDRDHRPPVAAALLGVLAGAVLGPAAQLQQPALWGPGGYALVLAGSLAVLLLALRLHGPGAGAAWFAAVALAAFAATGARACAFAAQALAPALEGRDLWLTGRVSGLPQRQADGVRFRLEVEGALLQGAPVRLPPRIALGWYGAGEEAAASAPPRLRPGERWRLAVRLKAPHGHANPHGFDYELWLWEQGVQATGYVRAGPRDPPPQRLASTWQAPVDRLRDAVRERIFTRVPEARRAGVLAALVVGDQGAIEREDWEVFRATGVAHLMSISGLHVTLFAWVAALAVGRAWRRSARLCLALPAPQAALAGGLALALAYAIFSGWGVPAQRTIWMLATVTALRWGAREWPWPCVWLLACAVVVTVDPWALLQPGFWLSFVAVGVLFASARPPPWQDEGPRRWDRQVLRPLAGLAREQWVVTLALTPLSLLLFGQVSLVGLVANLVAIPWVTWIVTPLGLLGVAWPVAWDAGAATAAALGAGLEWLSRGPWVTVSVAAAPLWAGIAGVAGGTLLVLPLPGAWRALGLPLLVPVLLWQPARPPPGSFELLAADVGQGNAVLVRTARRALLYDAGPAYSRETDAGQRVLVPLLRALGERLDLVVLSHRDVDHTGGAAAVLAAHGMAALVSSLEPGHELLRLRPSRPCEAGVRWDWDGVHFAFLHPSGAATAGAAPDKPNARSCVLLIVAADGGRALLAGDIERAQEAEVLQRTPEVHAHLLLVPHHGSKTSSSEAWLAAVAPALALVQAGYRNRFGHPAGEVVERYARRGIRLVATPACGAARWASRTPRELQCERALRPRYWQHPLR